MRTRSRQPWSRVFAAWWMAGAAAIAVCGCAMLRGAPRPVCDLSPVSLDEPPAPVSAGMETGVTNVPPLAVSPVGGPAAALAAPAAAVAPVAAAVPSNLPPVSASSSSGVTDYRVQPLDALRIEVFGEPDISGVFPVSAEGAVRHPLLGSIGVAGRTVAEVERQFVEVLGTSYLVSPRVSVRVEHSTGRRVTVLGEIKKPGTYSLPPEQPLTLLGLVATAGGFTDIADPKRVRILRDTGDSRDNTIRVNVNDLLRGRLDQTDIKLLPGDVVTIPEAIF